MTGLTHEQLVEKVARALCVAIGGEPDSLALDIPFWRQFTIEAEAAIATIREALKEPTEAMNEAGGIKAMRAGQSVYRSDHDHFPLKYTWETTVESVRAGWRKIAASSFRSMLLASPLYEEGK